ncbi:MAG: hypothetical protein KDD28_26995 [Phaeodactylibacter sp.]|nr:hypothetical protein [Phaeodactylibacter sp.]
MWTTKATYWLENDGSFAEGILLLQEKGISTRHLAPKSSKHLVTPAMKSALRNQVDHLLKSEHPNTPVPPLRPPRNGFEDQTETELIEVKKLRDRGKRLMKQRSRLHAMLCTAGSDEERYDVAYEMCVKVQPDIDQVYQAVRAWEESGDIPSAIEQDDIVEATVKKMLRRDSIKVRLSQLRSKLKKPGLSPDLQQQYEQEMSDKINELARLEGELGL